MPSRLGATVAEGSLVAGADNVSVGRWLAFYVPLVLLAFGSAAWMLQRQGYSWAQWKSHPVQVLHEAPAVLKLLVLMAYLMLCCTFVPLSTGWIAAALAAREAGLAGDAMTVGLLIGVVGAVASTIANLHDYHLVTWLLRRRSVARVRNTRLYNASVRWFAKSPFVILVIFNILPIPVDVVRILAVTYRYSRLPFAAANFVGRFVRYGVIAYATFEFDLGGWAAVWLLGLAVVLVLGKAVHSGVRRLCEAHACRPAGEELGR